jgi:TPR repeat protein
MTLRHNKISLLFIVIVLNTLLSLIACTEKSEDGNKVEKIAPSVSADKISQLQREAENGDPDAQYNLAYRYENGFGLPKDEAKALELYQKAADQGHSEAQKSIDSMKASK